jgi:hypothetical protein
MTLMRIKCHGRGSQRKYYKLASRHFFIVSLPLHQEKLLKYDSSLAKQKEEEGRREKENLLQLFGFMGAKPRSFW